MPRGNQPVLKMMNTFFFKFALQLNSNCICLLQVSHRPLFLFYLVIRSAAQKLLTHPPLVECLLGPAIEVRIQVISPFLTVPA